MTRARLGRLLSTDKPATGSSIVIAGAGIAGLAFARELVARGVRDIVIVERGYPGSGATGRNVARVSYATSLMKKGVLISTTEHLLSALVGMGIDNAYVDLDNLELPILDGSARPFVELIRKAGVRKQRRRLLLQAFDAGPDGGVPARLRIST